MAVKRKRSTRSLDGATTPGGTKVNGTPQSSKSASKAPVAWVDYKIKYPQLRKGKKGQRKSGVSDESPPGPQPYIADQEVYEVVPRTWNDLHRYKKFRLMEDVSDPMSVGDVVLVNNDDGLVADGQVDIFKQWKAHVLEIRAQDPQHVYLRVFWIYDPNELPGGRRPYHGEHELVPSNDMAIIDAMTINGPVSLRKWNEYDDEDEPYTGTEANPGFFWRQTFNVHTGRISQLRQHCFCNAPANPDNLLVQCTNKAICGRWLHSECLVTKAIQKAAHENLSNGDSVVSPSTPKGSANATPTKSPGSASKGKKKISVFGKESGSPFSAEVVAATGKKGHRINIKDIRKGHEGEEWEDRIHCPCCNSLLLDEGEEQPPTPTTTEKETALPDGRASADEITVKVKTDGVVDGVPPTPANAPSPSMGIIGSIASSIFGGGT